MEAGSILRQARTRVGLSQRQLSRLTGVAESRISDYENGRHQPSVAMLQRLVRAAGHDLVAVPRSEERRTPDPARNGHVLADLLSFVDAVPFGRWQERAGRGRPRPPTWTQLIDRGRQR
jgi:transcriptional regulator with XRE-family HTH domain